MVASTHAVGTLGYMIDKIADEIARSDLSGPTGQIVDKISEAITAYQSERFFFSETRDITFNTVNGQEFYTASDDPAITTLKEFDYLFLGTSATPLARRTDEQLELANQNGTNLGTPVNWSYYQQKIRFTPIPNATIAVRISATANIAMPGLDDPGNPWMTGHAERLIRCRAKKELYLHVIRNVEFAQALDPSIDEALTALRTQTAQLRDLKRAKPSAHVPGTLGYMKEKIADEIRTAATTDIERGDFTTQIADKINEAIEFYQPERFFFSESRDIVFNTSVGQEFYGDTTSPVAVSGMATLQAFDYIILYIGSIPWPIARRTDTEIEVLNQNGLMRGQPWNWSYYNEQLRLGPVPDATYQMRIAAHKRIPAPSSDDDTSSQWMTQIAERMIRCRAKAELYAHVLRNDAEATRYHALAQEAYESLKGQTNRLVGRSLMAPMEF